MKMMRKQSRYLLGVCMAMSLSAYANIEDQPIHSSDELSQWCKTLVE